MAKLACVVAAAVLLPAVATAGPVTVRFDAGYVTVRATDAPLREVLAEWARQGQTRFVNAEKIVGGPVTLELDRVPEKQAIEVLLRSVAGYVAAPRNALAAGASRFDRIVVMATSSAAPPAPAAARPPVRPPVFQPPMPPPDVDEQEEMPPGTPAGPPVLTDVPEDPDEPPTPMQGVPGQPPFQPGQPEGAQEGVADPNAPQQPPVVPGPTPLAPGVVTQPAPGRIPVPPPKPPQ